MKNNTEVNYPAMAVFFGVPIMIVLSMCVLILGGKEDNQVVGS